MITQDDIDAFDYYNKLDLTLSDYQNASAKTAIYPAGASILYPALGLAGEAGEVANKVKKVIRDGKLDRDGISDEIGDCLWYMAALCRDLNINLAEVAHDNLDKLNERKRRNSLNGSGDKR
jgi:NTP pyrophosphatase (non-canonical NTP hydrolase)